MRWGTAVAAVSIILLAVGASLFFTLQDEGSSASLTVLTPSSTHEVELGEGAVPIRRIIEQTGMTYDNSTVLAATADGEIRSVSGGTEITVRDGRCLLGGDSELLGISWGGGMEITTTMSVARTALYSMNLSAPGIPLVWAGVERVVVLELDGLGWSLYSDNIGALDNISGMDVVMPALTAYPPITNVGTAMAVTGLPPAENGIRARSDHTLLKPTFLEVGGKGGHSTAWIEGDSGFLDADMENNVDSDGDGTIDGEIHEAVMGHLMAGTEIVLGHYHSIDDSGHRDGPESEKHINAMLNINGYIGEVISFLENGSTPSILIVFSDHGMHEGDDGLGVHGEFRHEDMFSIVGHELLGGAEPLPEPGLTIVDDISSPVEITFEEFVELPSVESYLVIKGSKGDEGGTYRGVELSTVMGLYASGDPVSIRLTAIDGYTVTLPGGYADEGSGVILAYEKDGEGLGDDGPIRLIVPISLAGEYNGQECLKGVIQLEVSL